MADSPSKPEPDVEQNQQSGDDENNLMDRDQEGAPGQGLADFEVKEQDRWLPIANGWSRFICHIVLCYVRLAPNFGGQNLICSSLALPSCACARSAHALSIESGTLAGSRESCQVHLIRCVAGLRTSAMICIAALLSLVSRYLRPFIAHHVFWLFSNLSHNISHDKEGLAGLFKLRC